MINNIVVSESYCFRMSFGVDDADSLVKQVTAEALNNAGVSTATLKFYETGTSNVIWEHLFTNSEVIDLPAENYPPYSTRQETVPATGEEVTVMAGPDYSFG